MSEALTKFEQLRSERDRFVAFAFAAADVVLELDSHCGVCYAAGATQVLFRADSSELVGKELFDLIAREDCDRFRVAMSTTPAADRMKPVTVHLRGNSPAQVVMSGYRLPDLDGRYFLAVSRDRQPQSTMPRSEATRDEATKLFDKESFGSVVSDRIELARARGDDCNLTLFDLMNLDGFRERVDEVTAHSFVGRLSDMLRASSIDGDSAGRFAADTYGVLHGASLDVDRLTADIELCARKFDPTGPEIGIHAATVNVDDVNVSPEDTAKAVVYMINKFSSETGEDFTISTLSQGSELMVNETVARITAFKEMVRDGKFQIALQPIVELATGEIHHYEALARFDELGSGSPFALITFAEEVGVISEFDLAMSRCAVELLGEIEKGGETLSIAVNLSGRSLGSTQFVSALLSMLEGYGPVREKLLFEVTESSKIVDLDLANGAIQQLRGAGHIVCLDDFGAGSAAFQHLRTLKVDVVKIDGVYVREALTAPNGKAFFKAMTDLCRSLRIDVVAEMVEDWKTVKFLRECGVRFGQGYLFGKPVIGTSAFRGQPGIVIDASTVPHLARLRELLEQKS